MTEAETERLEGQDESPRASRLQRVREALARRDWAGIGIELAVVTLGILIAFQIDQWADRRKQAREERQFLERLHREYARAADELNTVVKLSHDKVMRDFQLAFAARGDRARLTCGRAPVRRGSARGRRA